jgi:hypothetical protein
LCIESWQWILRLKFVNMVNLKLILNSKVIYFHIPLKLVDLLLHIHFDAKTIKRNFQVCHNICRTVNEMSVKACWFAYQNMHLS